MTRQPRLPNRARTRPSPGQLAFFDPAALTKARHAYPDAIRFVPSRTGTALALLPGGTTTPATPVVARQRRAA